MSQLAYNKIQTINENTKDKQTIIMTLQQNGKNNKKRQEMDQINLNKNN